MNYQINVFPNLPEDDLAAFSFKVQVAGEEPFINHFFLKIDGHIHNSDSVSELRARGREQAKLILAKTLACLESD